jgi:hypothetical protein
MNATPFETFAIVELFGHSIISGKVSEQVIGGASFVRVDVPAVDGTEAYTDDDPEIDDYDPDDDGDGIDEEADEDDNGEPL